MQLVDQEIVPGSSIRTTFADDDGRRIDFVVTQKGLIIDVWEDGGNTWVGTMGAMAEEWYDFVYNDEGDGSSLDGEEE